MSQSDMTPGVVTFAIRRDPSCSAGPRRSTLRQVQQVVRSELSTGHLCGFGLLAEGGGGGAGLEQK